MGRAPCCDKANVKRGPWSPEEDATLRNYVQTHGIGGNWIALPRKAGLRRCGKSCRLRWLNYLRPDIKHGGFTEEEDKVICSLYNQLGSRWSVIAAQLPGRTDNDVKNYWNTKLKKKLDKINSVNPNPKPNLPRSTPANIPMSETYSGVFSTSSMQHPVQLSRMELTGGSEIGASSTHIGAEEGSSYVSLLSGNGGGEDDGVLMDFGLGNLPYDVLNGFWLQEKGNGDDQLSYLSCHNHY